MQNNRGLLIGVGAVVLIGVLAVGWYLASPLFIDNSVDEAFPFEVPSETEMAEMTEAEKMEKEFMEASPNEAELAAMSQEEMADVEDAVQAAAAVVMSDKAMDDPMPEAPETWTAVATGTFIGADDFHQGEGTATIYQLGDERILRFEAFNVTNGPDLHVILSSSPNPTARDGLGDYIDLGMIKGNIGNQNYEIPADVDLSQYQSIVIYCQPFHVVFATAVLN